MVKYIGFYVNHRSCQLWFPVIPHISQGIPINNAEYHQQRQQQQQQHYSRQWNALNPHDAVCLVEAHNVAASLHAKPFNHTTAHQHTPCTHSIIPVVITRWNDGIAVVQNISVLE